MRKIFIKFNVEANPEDFIMFQIWPEGGESDRFVYSVIFLYKHTGGI